MTLRIQLDKALAGLRDLWQAENDSLITEDQSQQRSLISQLKLLKIELDAKHEQDQTLTQIKNQLHDATSSLTLLNKEKKAWQDKLDSMQHQLSAAERQVRCLDHVTRHKLASRQKAGFNFPKRRGQTFLPSSRHVVTAMHELNNMICLKCAQLVDPDALECTAISSIYKWQAQNVLGDHLTAMMEDQAKKGYNAFLTKTVLEVFMTHWCSSIIEGFYPQQQSFTDLLTQLSTQPCDLAATCGKRIQIIQPSNVDFNEWVEHIIKELGHFLTIAGLGVKSSCDSLLSSTTLALVTKAYNLRTALAEKDICGGLEVVIVTPDTPFQKKWMADRHEAGVREGDVNFVAGTVGIGLQRVSDYSADGLSHSRTDIVLEPVVVLARTLDVKINR